MNIIKYIAVMSVCSFIALAGATPAMAKSHLTILDYAGYNNPHLFQDYVHKYGEAPHYSFFASQDEGFNKARKGFHADLAHPCVFSLSLWRKAGLLKPIDVSKIPQWDNVFPKLRKQVTLDGKVWMVPFDWGYTSLIYNPKKVKKSDVGLDIFVNPKYKGRVALPEPLVETYALAFLATGAHNWKHVTDKQFEKATKWLRRAAKNVKFYWTSAGEVARAMAKGEVDVTWAWNQTWSALKEENKPVSLALDQGFDSWICGYVNLKESTASKQETYDFLNAVLTRQSGKFLIDKWGYAHANKKSYKIADPKAIKAAGLDTRSKLLKDSFFTKLTNSKLRAKMAQEFQKIKAGF